MIHSLLIFVIQVFFLWARTWNIRSIAKGDIAGALISTAIINLSWLMNVAIGGVGMTKIVNGDMTGVLPVLCSLAGGLIGTYIGLKQKK